MSLGLALAILGSLVGFGAFLAGWIVSRSILAVAKSDLPTPRPGLRRTWEVAAEFRRACDVYKKKTGRRDRVALVYGLSIAGMLLFVGCVLIVVESLTR